jgi:hypothetical protein
MAETLAVHDFVPVAERADPVTWASGILRVFVREERGTLSIGEHAIDDGRVVPSFKWAEILSRKLRRAVLSVWQKGDAAELTLWSRGSETGRVGLGSLSDAAAQSSFDATALAEFAPTSARERLRSIRGAKSVEMTLQRLGSVLDVRALVLAGELEGVELRFRRAGKVDQRLYEKERDASDWAARAPHLARLNPLFSDFADLTPEEALREQQKPARRV